MQQTPNAPARRREPKYPESARDVPKGLQSGLRNYWYPVLESSALEAGKPTPFKMLGESLVAWRDLNGHPHVVRDKCPHRAAKLSLGHVLVGDLQCAWHGLRFNGKGSCTLIPWEPEDSPLLRRLNVKAYPAGEIGGYIWAYIGEPEKFPPPKLEDCVPEEFVRSDIYTVFRHPIEIWNCNWLQTFDGVDSYHAAMLHSDSQGVANDDYDGDGRPKKAVVPLEDRRMKLEETPHGYRGVALDRAGNPINHGHALHRWKGERFTLPGLHSLLITPARGTPPYGSRHYQVPVDDTHTLSLRFVAMRTETPEASERAEKLWRDVIAPRQRQVNEEDKEIIEALGDLYESRCEENLLKPDQDIMVIRRKLAEAYLAQLDGERPLPSREALVCPA